MSNVIKKVKTFVEIEANVQIRIDESDVILYLLEHGFARTLNAYAITRRDSDDSRERKKIDAEGRAFLKSLLGSEK